MTDTAKINAQVRAPIAGYPGFVEEARTLSQPVSVGGVIYPSRNAACEALGVRPAQVASRRHRGWSMDEAFGLTPRPQYSALILNGTTYKSVAEALSAFGISRGTYNTRRSAGWTRAQALGVEAPPAKPELPPLEIQGTLYPSLSAMARAFNLSYNTLYSRLTRVPPWSMAQAVGLEAPPAPQVGRGHPRTVQVGERTFASLSEAARAHGIDEGVFFQRYTIRKWTLKQALGLEPPAKTHLNAKAITVQGVVYPSFKAACDAYSLKDETVKSRIGYGWTIEEALGITPRKHKALSSTQTKISAEEGTLIIGGKAFRWK